MMSPTKQRQALTRVQNMFLVSERRACRVIGVPRSSQQYYPRGVNRETLLSKRMIKLATQYGVWVLADHGALAPRRPEANHKHVELIWRREGLKLPLKESQRRWWLTDGSCVRLRPEHARPEWSYDFGSDLDVVE